MGELYVSMGWRGFLHVIILHVIIFVFDDAHPWLTMSSCFLCPIVGGKCFEAWGCLTTHTNPNNEYFAAEGFQIMLGITPAKM